MRARIVPFSLGQGSMLSNVAAMRAGCLLEVRADAGYRTVSDVDEVFDQINREIAKQPPPHRYVAIVDWRRCPVMAPVAAERMGQRIAAMNGRTVRSAALARGDSPVAVLQFVRLIREANLPDRRLFFDAGLVVAWLAEVLTPPEMHRLRQFLSEAHAGGGEGDAVPTPSRSPGRPRPEP